MTTDATSTVTGKYMVNSVPATRELAKFASGLRYEDLPEDVVQMAKRCLLDSVGAGVYGSTKPWTQAVACMVEKLGQAPTASAWGSTVKADPLGTAMINGTSAQGFELDDVHDRSMSHYGASVIPAVLATAQGLGDFTGEELVVAIVVGYEVGTRIGNSVSPGMFQRGFHPCGPTGTFGATGAVAKLFGLDTETFVNALGLAGSQAAGLMASQYGAMAKRFHSGKAAQNGIIAGMAAREGLTGVRDVLEAPYGGFCSTYTATCDLNCVVDGLGDDYEIRRNGFKQYSSLASSQTSVDALRRVREQHNLNARDVERVLIETTAVVHLHCGWPYVPAETITAQMNLPYTAAVTLIDGFPFVDQYADERLRDPEILDLAARVEVVVDPKLDAMGPDEMRAVRVTVTTKKGADYSESVVYRSGHYKNPLSDETLHEKFRGLATRVLTDEAVERIIEVVDGLDRWSTPIGTLAPQLQALR